MHTYFASPSYTRDRLFLIRMPASVCHESAKFSDGSALTFDFKNGDVFLEKAPSSRQVAKITPTLQRIIAAVIPGLVANRGLRDFYGTIEMADKLTLTRSRSFWENTYELTRNKQSARFTRCLSLSDPSQTLSIFDMRFSIRLESQKELRVEAGYSSEADEISSKIIATFLLHDLHDW